MLIIIYSVIALLFFLIGIKHINFRRYYSTLLMMSYLRFLEQYIIVHVIEMWEYKNLPLPMSQVISVPMTLDLSIYPLLAYLFIKFVPGRRIYTFIYYLLFPLTMVGVESSLIWGGYLEHQYEWNFLLSYYLAFATFLVIHWQYKLFLKTGWHPQNNPPMV